MDVGTMMAFASYGWDDCSDEDSLTAAAALSEFRFNPAKSTGPSATLEGVQPESVSRLSGRERDATCGLRGRVENGVHCRPLSIQRSSIVDRPPRLHQSHRADRAEPHALGAGHGRGIAKPLWLSMLRRGSTP